MDFKDRSYNPPVNACIQDNFLQEGISLLDHFAGLAMHASLANEELRMALIQDSRKESGISVTDYIAIDAYETAKAMLKARKEALKDG